MDRLYSRDKFEYVWRNLLIDSSLLDGLDGEFEVQDKQTKEGIEVEIVEKKKKTRTMMMMRRRMRRLLIMTIDLKQWMKKKR